MYHVYLKESDNTWTPFHSAHTKREAVAWADAKGIDYRVDFGLRNVAERTFGRCVLRRAKKAA